MSLKLKRFNMNMIRDDSIVVMIGKRNTGKSFLTKDSLFSVVFKSARTKTLLFFKFANGMRFMIGFINAHNPFEPI